MGQDDQVGRIAFGPDVSVGEIDPDTVEAVQELLEETSIRDHWIESHERVSVKDKEEEARRREEGVIKFIASVWKVSTLADGGIRLVLDLEERAREHMPELARCQQNGIALEIEAKKSN